MAISCLKARIWNRITYRKVVNHLTLLRGDVEIAMHFLIVECADACSTQAERFRGEIQALSKGASLEMHIAVAAVAMRTGGAVEIADHRKCHASVAREILSETQARGRDALVARFDSLQLG